MPIKGLTETTRLPRVGKIHLGFKDPEKKGAPTATPYFVVPPEVATVVGEKPTQLPILFPVEDEEYFAAQFYKCYSHTRGLICRGDGETCRRMIDVNTEAMANRDTKEIIWKEGMPCEGKKCPYYGKQCREVMNLQFLLPTVGGLGVWQIDTSSINSMRNINSAIRLIKSVFGRIRMIPLLLTLEPIEVNNPEDGKTKTVRVLNLRTKGTLLELMAQAIKPVAEMIMPPPDEVEAPEDIPLQTLSEEVVVQEESPGEDIEDFWPKDAEHTTAVAVVKPEAVKPPEKPKTVEKAKGFIDLLWLGEALKTLRGKKLVSYTEANLLSYIKTSYKVEAKTVLEGATQLNKNQATHFVHRIQESLEMA